MFKQALWLKAKFLVSMDAYEMVLFDPGAPFDPEMMHGEEYGVRIDPPSDARQKLKLCIFPALLTFSEEHAANADDTTMELDPDNSTGFVSHKSFPKRAEAQRRNATVLSKAVVVLED